MNRTVWNVIIDLAAALLFVAMIATGYVLRFPLPPGTNRVLSLWGLSRHQWGAVHFWISLGLLSIIAAHLVLHWKWIVTVIGKRLRLVKTAHPSMLRSGIVVSAIFVVALGLFGFVVHASVRELAKPLHDLDEPSDHNPGQAGPQETRPNNPKSPAGLWNDVYQLLEKRCVSCHGPDRQLSGLRVDQREDLFGQNSKPAHIVPGNSKTSPLIDIVSGARSEMRMLDRHKLAEQEVALLRVWIDAGAEWTASDVAHEESH